MPTRDVGQSDKPGSTSLQLSGPRGFNKLHLKPPNHNHPSSVNSLLSQTIDLGPSGIMGTVNHTCQKCNTPTPSGNLCSGCSIGN
ncbi:hypothetical protein GGTG_09454 [Gaeumannomyces tritici R3-111a-1]|uniref:Uncharacterized protein n=1 Tax=Gaeumannomyces tritici (strain R3-111a-1) TaxID=644352 RepID=J3P7G3_GAET3|nr:hypothetical protein GGTG_09454 [Gaeumannomyces tritici R3-111a-1]EJT72594.1 hypothetical protein GGTG_09454 [Gaeumannomyces tritici R3-111a-1]